MYALTPVAPQQLRKHWPQILPGLKIVMARGRAEWIPEEVYVALFNGTASLHLAHAESGAFAGFFILTKKVEADDTPKMLIWIAFAVPGMDRVVEWALGEIEKMANSVGFKGLVFYSPRKGWGRRLAANGFRVTEYKLEKELLPAVHEANTSNG